MVSFFCGVREPFNRSAEGGDDRKARSDEGLDRNLSRERSICDVRREGRTVKAYMEETWDGDLMDIVSSSLNRFTIEFGAHLDNKTLEKCGFFEKLTTCEYRCEECQYCEDLARDLIRLHVLTRGKLEDVGMKEAADELEKAGKLPQQAFQ